MKKDKLKNKLNPVAKIKIVGLHLKKKYPAICYLTEIYSKPKDIDSINWQQNFTKGHAKQILNKEKILLLYCKKVRNQ